MKPIFHWSLAVTACVFLAGCDHNGDLANSTKMKCGDQMTYTPSDSKNAFRLRVQGECAVKQTVQCSGGTNPVPAVFRPGAAALVNCDPGKTVKTADLACEKAENKKCELTYEVEDVD